MILEIYKSILANGFKNIPDSSKENKRLGIKRSFADEQGRYIEIRKNECGYDLCIEGDGFTDGCFPYMYFISEKKEAIELKEFLNKRIKKQNYNKMRTPKETSKLVEKAIEEIRSYSSITNSLIQKICRKHKVKVKFVKTVMGTAANV